MATSSQVTLSSNSIVNGLLFNGWKWDVTSLSYFFAEDFVTWESHEKAAYAGAIQEWAKVSGLSFFESTTRSGADFVELLVDGTQMSTIYGSPGTFGFHETPDPTLFELANTTNTPGAATGEVNGVYNWQLMGMNPWSTGSLTPGGFSYRMMIHEIGHGLGLKHPHDVIGSAPLFPGVTSSNDLGDNNLAHMFSTVMAYNRGYSFDANGEIIVQATSNIVIAGNDILHLGYAAGPMAFDIAAIQHLYGASYANGGNDTYYLPVNNVSGEAMWRCIWDSGGTDTMQYEGSSGVIISLHAATLQNDAEGGGVLSYARYTFGGFTIANGVEIENAVGGSGADEIIGNDISNEIYGRAGGDTLYGELGNDTLDGGNEDASSDTMTGGYGNDTIRGYLGDDELYGDYKDVYIQGNDDQLFGGFGKDLIQGGGGNDEIYGDDSANENFTLGDDSDTIDAGDGNDTAYGGGLDDTITGGVGEDSLYGGQGVDAVFGDADNDFIDGGFGNDSLFGGAGMDVIYGGATDDDYIEAGSDTDTVDAGLGNDVIHGDNKNDINDGAFDNLKGGGGKDTVYGGGGADYIYGDFDYSDSTGNNPDNATPGADNDVLYGNGGSDNIYAGGGNDFLDGGDESGQFGGDFLNGGDGNDEIYGRNGNDFLEGGTGEDTMDGGDGNDSFTVDNKNDVVQEDNGEGTDTVYSRTFTYTASGNVEYFILVENTDATRAFGSNTGEYIDGNKNDNLLDGGGGVDNLVGNAGNDVLKGGAGQDFYVGGIGNDSYYIDKADVHKGYVSIGELANQGTRDAIYTSASFILANDQEIETIYLQTGAADVSGNNRTNRIVGNRIDNALYGSDGNDTLSGDNGNDVLYGGDDQDFLYGEDDADFLSGGRQRDELTGGLGKDRLTGGSDSDTFFFDSARESGRDKKSADVITDFANGEKIDLSGFSGKLGWVGKGEFSGKGGAEVGYEKTSGGVLARIDANGDGDVDMMIFCMKISALDKGDFAL